MRFSKFDLCSGVAVLLLLKLLCVGLSPADAAGASFILASLLGTEVVKHLFPKRPDLFKQVTDLESQIQELRQKTEENSMGLSAVRLGEIRGLKR